MGKFKDVVLGALGLAAGLGCALAFAGTASFDFGALGGNGGAVCASDCVLPIKGEDVFNNGGTNVGAIGYNSAGAMTYVTQVPGAFGSGETGLGESNTSASSSSADYEIAGNAFLLIDNSLAAGYASVTLSIESALGGEGAKIYSYTGPLSSLDRADLTLLEAIASPGTGLTQTLSVPDYAYLVVQGDAAWRGGAAADIVVSQETLISAVPEPSTWAMALIGFAGLGFAAFHRRRPAISIL